MMQKQFILVTSFPADHSTYMISNRNKMTQQSRQAPVNLKILQHTIISSREVLISTSTLGEWGARGLRMGASDPKKLLSYIQVCNFDIKAMHNNSIIILLANYTQHKLCFGVRPLTGWAMALPAASSPLEPLLTIN